MQRFLPLCLLLAACTPSDALVVGPDVKLAPGRLTIGTVAVGDPLGEVRQRLRPTPGALDHGENGVHFGTPGALDEVILSASDGLVHTIWGRSVERDGVRLFTTGSSGAQVHAVLGHGREEKHYSPTGGMITTGHVLAGATWSYEGPGLKLELWLAGAGFGGFTLQRTHRPTSP